MGFSRVMSECKRVADYVTKYKTKQRKIESGLTLEKNTNARINYHSEVDRFMVSAITKNMLLAG